MPSSTHDPPKPRLQQTFRREHPEEERNRVDKDHIVPRICISSTPLRNLEQEPMRTLHSTAMAVLLLASCGESSETREVVQGAVFVVQSGRIQQNLDARTSFGLYSAAASGDQVALLFGATLDGYVDRISSTDIYEGTSTTSSSTFQFALSEDAGKTWRLIDVPYGFPHGIPRRVFYVYGKLHVMGYRDSAAQNGFGGHTYGVASFDAETRTWGPQRGPFTTTGGHTALDGRSLRGFSQDVSPTSHDGGDPNALLGHFFWETLNLENGESEQRRLYYPYSEKCDGDYVPVQGGSTWWASIALCGEPVCQMGISGGNCHRKKREACISIATPAPFAMSEVSDTSLEPEEAVCVPLAFWPGNGELFTLPRTTGGFRVFQTYFRHGNSFAASLEFDVQTLPNAEVVETFIARGELLTGRRSTLGETYLADLFLIRDGSFEDGFETRLVRFNGLEGTTQVHIPPTICTDEQTCLRWAASDAHGNLEALLNTQTGYLAIYSVPVEHETHRLLKYYSKEYERVESSLDDTPPVPRTDLFLGCESPLPVTHPFERLLVEAVACDVPIGGYGPHPTSPGVQLGPVPVVNILVEEWFKATHDTRDAFQQTFESIGCAAFRQSIDLFPPGYPAVESEVDCSGQDTRPRCDGNILRSCLATVDCAELGLECVAGLEHHCGEEIKCSLAANGHSLCQGDWLFYDVFKTPRVIDCAELELKCVESGAEFPRAKCAP